MQHKRVTPILYHVTSDVMPISGLKGIDLNKFDQFLLQLAKRIRNKVAAGTERAQHETN